MRKRLKEVILSNEPQDSTVYGGRETGPLGKTDKGMKKVQTGGGGYDPHRGTVVSAVALGTKKGGARRAKTEDSGIRRGRVVASEARLTKKSRRGKGRRADESRGGKGSVEPPRL